MQHYTEVLTLLNVINILMGVYVGYRICARTSFIVRMAIMFPSIISVVTVNMYMAGDYNGYAPDVLREFSVLVLYALLVVMLSGKRVLRNIGMSEQGLCERKLEVSV